MTRAQSRVLNFICRTNGGGISVMTLGPADQKAFWSLHRQSLIQGKLGCPELAVHTAEGWRMWREQERIRTTQGG